MKGSVDVQKAMPEYIIFHVLKDRVIIKGGCQEIYFLGSPFFLVRKVCRQARVFPNPPCGFVIHNNRIFAKRRFYCFCLRQFFTLWYFGMLLICSLLLGLRPLL